jgi:hypothetical protein
MTIYKRHTKFFRAIRQSLSKYNTEISGTVTEHDKYTCCEGPLTHQHLLAVRTSVRYSNSE